jgi:hypothetical protein
MRRWGEGEECRSRRKGGRKVKGEKEDRMTRRENEKEKRRRGGGGEKE